MRAALPIGTKLLASHLAAVLTVAACTGGYLYAIARASVLENLRGRLQNSAALAAVALDPRDVERVSHQGQAAAPEYDRLLATLRRLARSNPDVAFLYVMRRGPDGGVYFVADSDESPTQAEPGRRYTREVGALADGFDRPSSDEEVYTDEWGVFLSGYAPVGAPGTYLVGLDMRAEDVEAKFRRLRLAALSALALGVVLAFGLAHALSRHFVRPIELLEQHSALISEGKLDARIELTTRDELGGLIRSYNAMARRLGEASTRRAAAEQALEAERDSLEVKVSERTRQLESTNDSLREEITERRRIELALHEAARTDALTGLANRRAMREQLDYQKARHARSGAAPFAVVIADIDHFKRVNDTWGHDAGDLVLREVASRLKATVRQQDIVARWGGEEFMVLLPDTLPAGAATLAEKLRAVVAAAPVACGEAAVAVTSSFGVAGFPCAGDVEGAIKAADVALYAAKQAGRDRVMVAPA